MYQDIDFYDLSEQEQQRLIRSKRVATAAELLSEVPENQPAVRVFEKPLENLIFERLETGRYTIRELADEFDVNAKDVRRIINKFRRHGKDDFTGEFFKYNLLSEWNGVIRVKNVNGTRFEYSLETIPFFARIADPTLVVALLESREQLLELPIMAEQIPSNTASEIDETYALLFGEFWEIDPQVIFDEITDYERTYVETSIAPLPIIEAPAEYRKVRKRFEQPKTVYDRLRNLEETIEAVGSEFARVVERGQPGVRLYQAVSIELFDMLHAAKLEEPALAPTIREQVEKMVAALEPETGNLGEIEDGMAENVSLEDEIMAVLSEDWTTADQVYDKLSVDVQVSTSLESVRGILDEQARFGVISSRTANDNVEYSSKSGTVNPEGGL